MTPNGRMLERWCFAFEVCIEGSPCAMGICATAVVLQTLAMHYGGPKSAENYRVHFKRSVPGRSPSSSEILLLVAGPCQRQYL